MSRKWAQRLRWLAVIASAGCAFVLVVLVAFDVARGTTGIWATIFIFSIGVIAASAALLSKDGFAAGEQGLRAWLQPKRLSILFLALLGGLGAMSTAKGVFGEEPDPAGDQLKSIQEIGNTLEVLANPVRPGPARIRRMLPGVWGEQAAREEEKCRGVTYRFAILEDALIVDSVREPEGASPYRLVATINLAEGDRMEVTGEEPPAARGRSVTFTYTTNGANKWLTWHDRSESVPLRFDRCS